RLQGDWSSDVCSSDLSLWLRLSGCAALRGCPHLRSRTVVRQPLKAAQPDNLSHRERSLPKRATCPPPPSVVQLAEPVCGVRMVEIGRATCRERWGCGA